MRTNCLAVVAVVILSAGRAMAQVVSGAGVEARGTCVVVRPGVVRIEGQAVRIANAVTLPETPAGYRDVVDEEYVLSSDAPQAYVSGTHLRGCCFRADGGGTVLPGCLVPGSVVVKLSSDGTVMTAGKDYRIDEKWAALGRIEGGRIAMDAKVKISYRVGWMRVDGVDVDRRGEVKVVLGMPKKNTPVVPDAAEGTVRLANVLRPYHEGGVSPADVFPVKEAFPEPDREEMERRGLLVRRTLEKLRRGDAVTVVMWGDSVTAGGDATPGNSFAEVFPRLLQDRFPLAKVTAVNAGVGATTTDMRLPKLKDEVLSHRPDLVVVEFVNDMGYTEAHERKNMEAAIAAIRDVGADVILITPHFTMPEMMGLPDARGRETRDTVRVLRKVAKEQRVGLADVSRRWEHLALEGIPYVIYLENGINHPDDRGHAMFVKELLTFFPR